MKLIGIEEHFLTTEVRDAWAAIGLEATDPSVAYHAGAIEQRLVDLAEDRLALMDETGLDVQVLSLTTPALHDLGPESVEMARSRFGARLPGAELSTHKSPCCRVWRRVAPGPSTNKARLHGFEEELFDKGANQSMVTYLHDW